MKLKCIPFVFGIVLASTSLCAQNPQEQRFENLCDGRYDLTAAKLTAFSMVTLNPMHIVLYQKIKLGYQKSWTDLKQTYHPKSALKLAWFGAHRAVAINNMCATALAPWYWGARMMHEVNVILQKRKVLEKTEFKQKL